MNRRRFLFHPACFLVLLAGPVLKPCRLLWVTGGEGGPAGPVGQEARGTAAVVLGRGGLRTDTAIGHGKAAGAVIVAVYLVLCAPHDDWGVAAVSVLMAALILLMVSMIFSLARPSLATGLGASGRWRGFRHSAILLLVFIILSFGFATLGGGATYEQRKEREREAWKRRMEAAGLPEPAGNGIFRTESGHYVPAFLEHAPELTPLGSYEPLPAEDRDRLEEIADKNAALFQEVLAYYRSTDSLPTICARFPVPTEEKTFRQLNDSAQLDLRAIRRTVFCLSAGGDLAWMRGELLEAWKLYRAGLLLAVDSSHGFGFETWWLVHTGALAAQKIPLTRLLYRFHSRRLNAAQERAVLAEVGRILAYGAGILPVLQLERTAMSRFHCGKHSDLIHDAEARWIGAPLYLLAMQVRDSLLLTFLSGRATRLFQEQSARIYSGFEAGITAGIPDGLLRLASAEKILGRAKRNVSFADRLFSPARSYARLALTCYVSNFRRIYLIGLKIESLYNALKLIHLLNMYHRVEGVYPPDLETLAARGLADIPPDAVTGEPLEYVPEGDSYTVRLPPMAGMEGLNIYSGEDWRTLVKP